MLKISPKVSQHITGQVSRGHGHLTFCRGSSKFWFLFIWKLMAFLMSLPFIFRSKVGDIKFSIPQSFLCETLETRGPMFTVHMVLTKSKCCMTVHESKQKVSIFFIVYLY